MAVANANVRQTYGGTLHMGKAIATVALSGTLTDKFEAIAAAGFDGAEIFEPNLLAHDGSAREVAQYARDLGLSIDLFQPSGISRAFPTSS